ncbi:nonsense-mediated mRNA decay factor SMG7 [Argentina anserina]|uniref:nonsense-mediated mRNA decay factor SMG7 n=1 Tax=Argentina anserina TaxID=57926 RepID=UPI0021764FA4|nr:nonsense-mediated mRNA decay factor SMG7 [Potentilla anserina]
MITETDKMSAPSSWERAQRWFDKITELESRRRRSAQARVPSDPNAWQQIRENYEAIILEDHAFSEQHNVEYALWQLHYKRIEELRAHFSAAMASTGSNSTQGLKGTTRPDRIAKIRLQFKTFLSEATGFYHDLIVKIRAKYGLPLGYFSEDSENRIVMDKDGKKSADVKKGLISCHRCLIYLGDLARYKGLYGEGDSKTREYAAASSYYLQAASCLPSSGNPHHQLAILASYLGDEVVTVYRYFRSLAVDNPFSTARDNLIVAFEKNRQSYSQLSGNANASALKEMPARLTGKSRGKGESVPAKDKNSEVGLLRERSSSNQEKYKAFSIRFVRLNGILFTRTSLETFAEVLSAVSKGFSELLSSGAEETLFDADGIENGLVIVRLVSILIFTVHNVKKESEGQSYAEIVQRPVLLQNAFTAVFELMGHVLERCVNLGDPTSCYLLPGILVFVEWLACCPDVAVGSEADENQSSFREKFWNACILLLNNLLSSVPMSLDDDGDETCFNNMSRYEEGETENRLALWEDFELRGFIPLLPAQTILDFSRKHPFGSDGQKEKLARVKRILAAGKALANMVKVDQKAIYFDSQAKKFVIGVEPPMNSNYMPTSLGISNTNDNLEENKPEDTTNLGVPFQKPETTMDGDEEDEVIVFKPMVAEKRSAWEIPQPLEPPVRSEEISLANNLKSLGLMGNGQVLKSEHVSSSLPFQHPVNGSTSSMFYSHARAPEALLPFKVDIVASSGPPVEGLTLKTSSAFPAAIRKNPVSRPVRHLGPPPGFSHVPAKQVNESMGENPLMDDYSWLDGYHVPSSTKGNMFSSSLNYSSHPNLHRVPNGNGLNGPVNFPFPGKQGLSMPFQAENQKSQQDFHMLEDLKLHHEMQLQQQQQFVNGNPQLNPQPEQYQGQPVWTGRYFV